MAVIILGVRKQLTGSYGYGRFAPRLVGEYAKYESCGTQGKQLRHEALRIKLGDIELLLGSRQALDGVIEVKKTAPQG